MALRGLFYMQLLQVTLGHFTGLPDGEAYQPC